MTPLWRTREGLMPFYPEPKAVPHVWRRSDPLPLAARSAELVPVGRGGERRAMSRGNPGLPGDPYTTPTLWAAIQYLAPARTPGTPARPVGIPVRRAGRGGLDGGRRGPGRDTPRGDLQLTPAGRSTATTTSPTPRWPGWTAWTSRWAPSPTRDSSTSARTRCGTALHPAVRLPERLWGEPGLTQVALTGTRPASPLMAYRWAHTDGALTAQLQLEYEGVPGVVEPGHAAVRHTNPTIGADALTTMRTEIHRLRADTRTAATRTSASSVWQVFDGNGSVLLNSSAGPSGAVTSSQSRPGPRSRSAPPASWTCSPSPTPWCSPS
jgi:gentisate 1,2-dioxygenase